MSYRYLDHTADLLIQIEAESPTALFQEATEAFTASVTELLAVAPRQERRVALESEGLDRLLRRWLEELLFLFEVDGWLAREASVSLVEESPGHFRLEGLLTGEELDLERHRVGHVIKAVTYHGLEVRENEQGLVAEVIMDI